MKKHTPIDQLFNDQKARISKLQHIVEQAMREEKPILSNLTHPPLEAISRGQRLADRVAGSGGSWSFILLFVIVLTAWILFNSFAPARDGFDPYPFILMNLVLSFIAAPQAPVIMMSQNRQEEKERKRSENDYLGHLKAELEVRSLHRKMDLLLQDDIKILFDVQEKRIKLPADIDTKLARPSEP